MKRIVITLALILSLSSYAQDKALQLRAGSFPQAIELGKEESKYIFVYFKIGSSVPCERFEKLVLNNTEVTDYLNNNYITIIADCSSDDSRYLLETFQIIGYPTVIIIDPETQEEIGRIEGTDGNSDSFLEAIDYLLEEVDGEIGQTIANEEITRLKKLEKEYTKTQKSIKKEEKGTKK